MPNRRNFFKRTAGYTAGLVAASQPALSAASEDAQVKMSGGYGGHSSLSLSKLDAHNGPVSSVPTVTTEVGDLPYEWAGDVKVFHLRAHVFKQQIAPNKTIDVWGFNGSAPGPTIQVTQGDQVRVIFENQLPEPSSIHWHGFEDAIGNDGMPGISQEPIKPGQSFTYNFRITQEGTFFYHSHMAMQEMAGMLGAFIMHPKIPYRPHCDKDFVVHLQEYWVLPNNTSPNTMNMEFNWLLLNGKAGPASTPLLVKQGERVRIRFINLGMDHHPMHLHGHTFYVTGTEGGRIPETAWWPGNTVLVGVAQARDVEFVANNPGDWMLHCHLPHHMMNQMASQVGPMTRNAYFPKAQTTRALQSGKELDSLNGATEDIAPSESAKGMPGMEMETGMKMEPGGVEMQMSPLQKQNANALNMRKGVMADQNADISPNAGDVPDFPQDAYMEGPMMNMDELVNKPENLGLRPNWSQYMQGMMTFVRVLPEAEYNRVIFAMRQANRQGDPYSSVYRDVSAASL